MLFQKNDDAPKLNQETFRQLRDLIHQNSGLYFADSKLMLLEDRLAKRLKMNRLSSYEEYLALFGGEATREKEMAELFNAITTWETSFFRDPAQLQVFREKVLPELSDARKKDGGKPLQIWSAGCSTGEEAYTLAMLAREHTEAPGPPTPEVRITGTDLSDAALDIAKSAQYGGQALRSVPPELRVKYFDEGDNGQFVVSKDIRKIVTLRKLNFANRTMISTVAGIDVIFCRNVITYFDDTFKKWLVEHFHNSLRYGGYLFLGKAESLHNIADAFQLVQYEGALAYRKE